MRSVPAQSQNDLRDRVIESINAGMRQAEAARTFGVADRSIRRWVARMKAEGLSRVVPRVRGRRAGQGAKLNAVQAESMRGLLGTCMPDQLGLPDPLWTRAAVADVVAREFGVALAPTTVINYLKAWDIRPPVPAARPQVRHDALVAQWLLERYPRIAARAGRDKACILWGDVRDVRGAAWRRDDAGPLPQLPPAHGVQRLLSVVTNRGTPAFQLLAGDVDAQAWIVFLQRLLKHVRGRRVVLIVPGPAVYGMPALRAWIEAHAGRIALHVLPAGLPQAAAAADDADRTGLCAEPGRSEPLASLMA
jgi:transposase